MKESERLQRKQQRGINLSRRPHWAFVESFTSKTRVFTPNDQVDSLSFFDGECAVSQQARMDNRVPFPMHIIARMDKKIGSSFETAKSEVGRSCMRERERERGSTKRARQKKGAILKP
jgi:hypothetical protein